METRAWRGSGTARSRRSTGEPAEDSSSCGENAVWGDILALVPLVSLAVMVERSVVSTVLPLREHVATWLRLLRHALSRGDAKQSLALQARAAIALTALTGALAARALVVPPRLYPKQLARAFSMRC
uniref:Uncharacterized protein n=1 Tax=Ixodes ricinus TaxID=34613 RepID=A0A6B0UQA7_IXORI